MVPTDRPTKRRDCDCPNILTKVLIRDLCGFFRGMAVQRSSYASLKIYPRASLMGVFRAAFYNGTRLVRAGRGSVWAASASP